MSARDPIAHVRSLAAAGRREAERFESEGRPDDARFVRGLARWWDKQADREEGNVSQLQMVVALVGAVRARLLEARRLADDREFAAAAQAAGAASESLLELAEVRKLWLAARAESVEVSG